MTENGKVIAQTAGNTILDLSRTLRAPPVIYSSRLQRSIETAYEIAKILGNLPIFVSSALSLTALAVENTFNELLGEIQGFDFLSLDEIKALCPDVQIISCDEPTV